MALRSLENMNTHIYVLFPCKFDPPIKKHVNMYHPYQRYSNQMLGLLQFAILFVGFLLLFWGFPGARNVIHSQEVSIRINDY